jgi:hypothetical protein
MSSKYLRSATALAIAAIGLSAQAATVNYTDWAYGNSWSNKVTVDVVNESVAAGGFIGSVTFAPGGEQGFGGTFSNFVSYCVELTQSFYLPSGNMSGYNVLAASDYTEWNNAHGNGRTAAATGQRLGQLLSYAASSGIVQTAAQSTSLQLAIWNVIYDTDNTVNGGLFQEKSGASYDAYANQLLADSASWSGMLDVYVLQNDQKQDFVLTRNVPEPASLALVMLGLGAVGAARRRARKSG